MTEELSWSRSVAAFVLLAATSAALVTAGGGQPSVPLVGGDGLEWLHQATPGEVAVAVVRLATLALCGYLAVALGAAVVVELMPWHDGARRVRRVTPSFVRRVVARSARSGLTTGVVLGWLGGLATTSAPASAQQPPQRPSTATATAATTAAADDPASHTATMTRLDDNGPASATMVALDEPTEPELPPGGPATTVPGTSPGPGSEPGASPSSAPPPATSPGSADGAPSSSTPEPVPSPISPAPGSAPSTGSSDPTTLPPSSSAPAAPSPVGPSDWVVAPGESFWSIAEEALTDARGGAPPDQQEVARYWEQLVAANRDRLVAPGNPDLLVVGQVIHVPPTDHP
jgi:hypothetical protein